MKKANANCTSPCGQCLALQAASHCLQKADAWLLEQKSSADAWWGITRAVFCTVASCTKVSHAAPWGDSKMNSWLTVTFALNCHINTVDCFDFVETLHLNQCQLHGATFVLVTFNCLTCLPKKSTKNVIIDSIGCPNHV